MDLHAKHAVSTRTSGQSSHNTQQISSKAKYTASKDADVQTDSLSGSRKWPSLSHVDSSNTSSSGKFSTSPKLTADEITRYIESKMKEQYMEQTRALEQIQLQMQQQLLQKQTQLLEHIKTLENERSDTSEEIVGGPPDESSLQKRISDSPELSEHESSRSSSTSNKAANRESKDLMSNSVSVEESLTGNLSQESSHDTWDSSNAFTYERPVLTGSERSTPIPVLPSTYSSNDLELISQSIHIPVDDKSDPLCFNAIKDDTKPSLFKTSDDVLTSKPIMKSMSDSFVRSPSSAAGTATSVVNGQSSLKILKGKMNENEDTSSPLLQSQNSARPTSAASSSAPPDSPSDLLSASLRLSLRQKHSRHLDDLKAYYESELAELREKLTSESAICQHECYVKLERENAKLRERCNILEQELLRANRYIDSVDKQMEQLESSLNSGLSTQNECHSSANINVNSDVEMYKNKLVASECYIASLERRNNELFSALCDAYEVRDNTTKAVTQETKRYNELHKKYDELKLEHEVTMVKLRNMENGWTQNHKEQGSPTENTKFSLNHQPSKLFNALLSSQHSFAGKQSISSSKHPNSHQSGQASPVKHYIDKQLVHPKQELTIPDSNSNDLSLNPSHLSDTQSSESSIGQRKSRRNQINTNRRSNEKHTSDNLIQSNVPGADDLISAYSPVVDRQRHSSNTSGGPAKSALSPHSKNMDRPYGFHHVGASTSPKKTPSSIHLTSKEISGYANVNKDKQGLPLSAKKSLTFTETSSSSQASAQQNSYMLEADKKSHNKVSDHNEGPFHSPSSLTKSNKMLEDKLKLVSDAETRLDELLLEKRQLESMLTRTSASNNRKDRQRQESLERQLDRVDKDLGSVKMTLRRYNAL